MCVCQGEHFGGGITVRKSINLISWQLDSSRIFQSNRKKNNSIPGMSKSHDIISAIVLRTAVECAKINR